MGKKIILLPWLYHIIFATLFYKPLYFFYLESFYSGYLEKKKESESNKKLDKKILLTIEKNKELLKKFLELEKKKEREKKMERKNESD